MPHLQSLCRKLPQEGTNELVESLKILFLNTKLQFPAFFREGVLEHGVCVCGCVNWKLGVTSLCRIERSRNRLSFMEVKTK